MPAKLILNEDYIISEYNLGKSFNQIAIELNCSKRTILDRAKKLSLISRKSGRKGLTILGKKFGKLQVVSIHPYKKYEKIKYKCICECGNINIRPASELIKSDNVMCYDCRNKFLSNLNWKGYGEISGEFWERCKTAARCRDLSFELTIEQGWKLFLNQNKKCALSGINIKFFRTRENRSKTTASLDRINSKLSYTIDNVQWVHKTVNKIKQNLSDEQLIYWCNLISENNHVKS